MPSYKCIDCGREINYSRLDLPAQRCPDCSLVITMGRYDVNISGGLTLFASTGENLGHKIISEVIYRYYETNNPNEKIVYLDPVQTLEINENGLFTSDVNKLFWADISNIINAPNDTRVIHYYAAREASALADIGWFPEYREREEISGIDVDKPFFVLHLRNVHGNPEKNVTRDQAKRILELFNNKRVFIIGNDMPYYGIEDRFHYTNLRGKLNIDQIAWLCGHENCIAVIGRDSGPLHLAAAVGAKVIGCNYADNRYWVPKARNKQVKAFVNTINEFEEFIKYVGEFINANENLSSMQNENKLVTS